MGEGEKMVSLRETLWPLQFIGATGFCRFLLQQSEMDLRMGLIVVAEDAWSAQSLAQVMLETFDSKNVKSWNKRHREKPLNFELGIHVFHKNDKEEEWTEFLSEQEFLPIVLVGGIVPDKLLGKGYILPLFNCIEEVLNFKNIYLQMQDEVITNPEHILYELQRIPSSKLWTRIEVEEKYYGIKKAILASAVIWAETLRNQNSEQRVLFWLEEFLASADEILTHIQDCEQECYVAESVGNCIVAYFENNGIQFSPLDTGNGDADILYDDEFYYVKEELLRIMCAPLLEFVSFAQLKHEMWKEGILICNGGETSGYTVKKSYFDQEKGRYCRKRFVKLKKQGIHTSSGLRLEDADFLNQYEEEYDESRDS